MYGLSPWPHNYFSAPKTILCKDPRIFIAFVENFTKKECEMLDYYEQLAASPYNDSLKVLEADIQHANMLAASIPRRKSGTVRTDGRSNISSCGRKATISEFYNVILPSLQRLHGDSLEMDITQEEALEMAARKRYEDKIKLSDVDLERENECGICLEPCTKMEHKIGILPVLPGKYKESEFRGLVGSDMRQ
ncbi:GDSL-like Lipase/Acylhydrolase superfamily protein [Prunus dulcis]|uniref:GDSL-like Lipase/Acylhydrolase superfamily protein n=1 Tax=Prunus dulcis TaxID=3755 RepID=A0A4Y1RJ22_PRUDU|nr:GDSL-like Lipase/Acylhydrolase superfamily protein [Prunus dulcis]